MHLFLVSEKFYCPPSDNSYLLELIAAETPEAALEYMRWTVHGVNTAVWLHWDVFHLGEFTPNERLPSHTIGDNTTYQVANFDCATSPRPELEFQYREATMHRVISNDEVFYIEDLDAITNYGYVALCQSSDDKNAPQYVERREMPHPFKPTGYTCEVSVGEYVPRPLRVNERIEAYLKDHGQQDKYATFMAKVRDWYFSHTFIAGWVEVVEEHDSLTVTVWAHPEWEECVFRDLEALKKTNWLELADPIPTSSKGD